MNFAELQPRVGGNRHLLSLWTGILLAAAGAARAESIQYGYDSAQRLMRVTYGNGTVIDYSYDTLGNRLARNVTLAGTPGNHAPGAASGPSIANGATNVSVTPVLGWNAATDLDAGDAVMYEVYFGTTPSPPLTYIGWQTNWTPAQLDCYRTYYWYVVTTDTHGAQTTGPVWSFTTGNIPPVANFIASPSSGTAPLTVNYSDQTLYHCGELVRWQWDFTNDGTTDSTNRNPTFTYSAGGDYTVKLTVSDEHGGVSSVVKTNVVSVLGSNIVDLAPLRLKLESAASYRNLVVSYAVTNRGSLSVSASWHYLDRFYLSTNAVVDANAISVADFQEVQPLPPGYMYSRTNLVPLPDVALDNYYLLLKADGGGDIGELNENNNVLAIALHGRLPDLAAASLSSSGAMVAGQAINITYAVTNRGGLDIRGLGGTPAEREDMVYVSTKSYWDTNALTAGYVDDTRILAAGAGSVLTNAVKLPNVLPGNYFLLVAVNANGSMVESNKANNALSLPLTLSTPDLAAAAFLAPAAVTGPPNSSVTLVWGVTNRGNGPASGNWYDAVYLSTNASVNDASLVAQDYNETGPVAAGGSYWRTNSVSIPLLQSGSYYLLFVADAFADLGDSNPGNNTLARPVAFTIKPPDLAMAAVQAPSSVTGPPNPTLTLAWGVTNRGSGPAEGEWYDAIYLSSTPTLDSSASSFADQTVTGPVAGGGVYWRTNVGQVPVLQSGTYYLIFATDDYDELYESNETNNSLAVPVTFTIQPPDLAALAFQAPNSFTGAPNPTLTLVWGVTNRGGGPAQNEWSDAVYLSAGPVLDLFAFPFETRSEVGPLASGGSYWRTNAMEIPVVRSGTYYLIFKTDYDDSLFESDTNNNTLVSAITCTIKPCDLAVLSFQSPATAQANSAITLIWGVTNLGPGQAVGGWEDEVYLTTNGLTQWPATLLAFGFEPGPVGPGESYWQTNVVRLPPSAQGQYSLVFAANHDQTVYEPVTWNNSVTNTISITPATTFPDLAPASLQAPAAVAAGQMVSVSCVATNQGTGVAVGPWYDALLLSSDPVDLSDAALLGMQTVNGPVSKGGSYSWTNSFTYVPADTAPGDYYFVVQLDYLGDLLESDTNDNFLAIPVTVQPPSTLPDLAPFSVAAPASAAPGQAIQVTWSVTNAGVGAVTGSWYDLLWLSTNTGTIGATPLAVQVISGPLAPGGTYSQTKSVGISPSTVVGSYYLVAQVDAMSQVGEANESNNSLAVPIQIQTASGFPDLAPVKITAPAQATPGQVCQVVCVVTNQGTAAAMAPWSDSLVLSTNTTWHTYDVVLGAGTRTQSLAAATSYSQTNLVTLPAWSAGTYYLVLKTDTANAVTESTETNNTLAVPVLCHTIKLAAAVPNLTNGVFQLLVQGLVGTNYTLVASTNLAQWTRVLDFTCTNSPMLVSDLNAGAFRRRFYRVAPLSTNAVLRLDVASPRPWLGNGLKLALDGPLGKNIRIETSTNLVQWSVSTNFSSPVLPLLFSDPASTSYKLRFYRAVTP